MRGSSIFKQFLSYFHVMVKESLGLIIEEKHRNQIVIGICQGRRSKH